MSGYEGEKGKVILAFSGCGKTYFCKHNVNWIDIEYYVFSSFYHSKLFENLSTLTDWYKYNVFLNTPIYLKDVVIDYIILPSIDMRDEIIARLSERDENLFWPEKLKRCWASIWASFNNLTYPKIYLKPGQYVSDVIDEKGNVKPGVEVIV